MSVSPYLLLKNSVANAISEQAEVCYKKWTASWNIGLKATPVCLPASQHKSEFFMTSNCEQRLLQNGSTVWIHIPDALRKNLEQFAFGLDNADATMEKNKHSVFADKVVAEALHELINALISAICQLEILPESAIFPPQAHLFKRGSGAVVCELSNGDNTPLRILLPDAAISHQRKSLAVRAKSGLTSLQVALKNTPVTLHVEVSDAELTLGYLATLAIGDVLKLPNKLDQTLKVMTDDDTTVCNAHLGSSAGSLAIEVVKSN